MEKFFAVTIHSVYEVVAYNESDCPYIKKIATNKEKSSIPVGGRIDNGSMLAIAKYLQFYFPEGHSMLSQQVSEERRLEHVNTQWWGGGTSLIVALFLIEEEALSCFEQPELKPCDSRWINKTKEVTEAIGDNHPNVTVCHWPELALI